MDYFFLGNESFFSLNEPAIYILEFSALFMATIVVSAVTCLEIGLLIQKQSLKKGEPVQTEENHLEASNLTGEFRP